LIIEKKAKKRAYTIKTDDGCIVGAIDYLPTEHKWRFNSDSDVYYYTDSLRQLVDFMDSLKDTEGDRALFG